MALGDAGTLAGACPRQSSSTTCSSPGPTARSERFRATLAALLLAEPAPRLLLPDEPTNSLDLASTRQLAQALAAYRGALLVASHDLPFLGTIGVTRWLRLEGRLTPIDPP
jgi:ATPase subunit of ABC transporter with duplicated ATPase domains